MGRSLLFSIASLLFPLSVSADFGFTNPSFQYVQLSSPQALAWNGQSGLVTLRLMVYPADSEQSYLPIAANLSGASYTWIPDSLATGSKWTLEGVDADGNMASSLNPFVIQGVEASGSNTATTSLMQQKPQTTPSSTLATQTIPTTTPTSTPTPTSTTSPSSPPADPTMHMSTGTKVGIFAAAIVGAALIVGLATFLFLRHRRNRSRNRNGQNSLRRDSIEMAKGTSYLCELEGNGSSATLDTLGSMNRPFVELKGSALAGSVPTSMGDRVELG